MIYTEKSNPTKCEAWFGPEVDVEIVAHVVSGEKGKFIGGGLGREFQFLSW